MTTEYRRNIPSVAHVEAAKRLGLLWEDDARNFLNWNRDLDHLFPRFSYRPIRPDGTPIDWEVLDAEVARVAEAAGTVQPQGFRADLWRRICRHFIRADEDRVSRRHISDVETIERRGCLFRDGDGWQWLEDEGPTRTDILARWAVYQELKPLYDLVDGAMGEAAMPADVEAEWSRQGDCSNVPTSEDWILKRGRRLTVERPRVSWHPIWRDTDPHPLGLAVRNFAAVLDAVAEARVRARQSPANPDAVPQTVTQSAPPEPRRFADVRPDRHGWRWWRTSGSSAWGDNTRIEIHNNQFRVHLENLWRPWAQFALQHWLPTDRTVIPTDEQGNPVSWESIGQGANSPIVSSIAGTYTLDHVSVPLPRFTADELDDVDHSRTTKLDQATLRRGRLPTVEQIAKYHEVRAKRTGGTVADALKESRIDCEVAQYVLERWAGGLGDADTVLLLRAAGCITPLKDAPKYSIRAFDPKQDEVDKRAQDFLRRHNTTLDTTEPPDTAAQQARQQAEDRRQRLAQVQAQIAAERAAAQPHDTEEPHRFDLIEPDPQADPIVSIRAWEARQAAVKSQSRPSPCPTAATMPETRPRVAPAIDVVDAEADGLSRGDVVLALLGRAMNRAC